MDNFEIVTWANKLLKDNQDEWEERYKKYADEIKLDKNIGDRQKFHIPKYLNVYSSISRIKSTTKYRTYYDLRFEGQSIGTITVKNGEVYLSTKDKDKNNSRYFQYHKSLDNVEWHYSTEAIGFRRHFKSLSESIPHSPEHKIEQFLLSEFSKKTRASQKKLCSIQPVRLGVGDLFFQMPTPLKASDHYKKQINLDYAKENGGGIDILARIKDKGNNPKLVVLELKDENTEREPQNEVMWQALAYATFIAHLLRSKSGTFWWERVFGFKSGSLSDDKPLEIIVATIMPQAEETGCKEGELNEISIEELNIKLIPQTLYFEKDENGRPASFSGTFKDNLYRKGECESLSTAE